MAKQMTTDHALSRRQFLKAAALVTGFSMVCLADGCDRGEEASSDPEIAGVQIQTAPQQRTPAAKTQYTDSVYAWQDSYSFQTQQYQALMVGDATGQDTSLCWPFVIRVDDKLDDPLGIYYLFYSSDHAHGGISLAFSDSPLGPFTSYGSVYQNFQCEAPSIIWDAENKLFLMFFHGISMNPGEAQSIWRVTSADGVTWDANRVKALHLDPERLYGNLHNGYMLPFRIGGNWFAYTLMGDDFQGSALHWSEDGGYTWYTDHGKLGRWAMNLNGQCFSPHHGTVIFFQGQYWFLGIFSSIVSDIEKPYACIAMVALEDLRTVVGRPVFLVIPSGTQYDSFDLRSLTTFCEYGKIYIYYTCASAQASSINCVVLSESEIIPAQHAEAYIAK